MQNNVLSFLSCPVCGEKLLRIGKSLVCPNRHTFDIAKSGYVNLLPPGKEKNAHTGDEREMIRARADFLSRGYYKNISTVLARHISEKTDMLSSFCDLGSGEGYHTVNIAGEIGEKTGSQITALGVDASKYGAECASKLSAARGFMPKEGIGADFDGDIQAYFIPANIFSLPIRDESLGFTVSMFAPIPWKEAARVTKKGGLLAVVSSGKNHLIEMRNVIYENVHETDFLPVCDEGFSKIGEESLMYTAHLSSPEEIKNLFTMTPFFYKTTAEGRERLYSLSTLDVTVSVNYSFFKKI